MSGLTIGIWDIADQTLRWIGEGTVWFLTRRSGRGEDKATYALIGGALVGAVSGDLIGFALSDFSRDMPTIEGALIGGLMGACLGVFFGSFVETVDGMINDFSRSLNPKE